MLLRVAASTVILLKLWYLVSRRIWFCDYLDEMRRLPFLRSGRLFLLSDRTSMSE